MNNHDTGGYFTPEGNAANTTPSTPRRSIFTRSKSEGQHDYEQRMKRTVKVPDPERLKYARREEYTIAELNKDRALWITALTQRSKDVCDVAAKTIEEFSVDWQVPYRNPQNNQYETHRVVFVKLNHPQSDIPWRKVACVEAGAYLEMVRAGLPLRWGITGSMHAPTARVKCYSSTGTTKTVDLIVARYLMSPPLDKYLRFLFKAGVLIPSNFQVKTPRGKIERRSLRTISPRQMLAEHHHIIEIDEAGGSVDFVDPRKHLIRHTKVDLEYMATWNVPGHEPPHEMRQDGIIKP